MSLTQRCTQLAASIAAALVIIPTVATATHASVVDTSASTDATTFDTQVVHWSECIEPNETSTPDNALVGRFPVRLSGFDAILFCGNRDGSAPFYGGVRHIIQRGHGFDNESAECIQRVLSNFQRVVDGTDTNTPTRAYEYTVPNYQKVTVVVVVADNSIRTVYSPDHVVDYDRCIA